MNSTSVGLPNKPTFTPQEVAYALAVSIRTVYRWRDEGKLEGFKTPGRAVRFRREVIIDIMANSE